MRSMNKTVLWCSLALVLVSAPAFASDKINGEVGAVWWSSEIDAQSESASGSTDAGAPGFRAELWLLNRYGMRASQIGAEPNDIDADGASYTSLDMM